MSAPVLLDAALEDDAAIAQAALAVIDGLQGPAIDTLIAQRLPPPAVAARKILIELAGRRHVAAATATLWKAADDADAKVRTAALTALGGTIQFAELSQLIARLRAAQNAGRSSRDCQGLAGRLAADARPGGLRREAGRRPWRAPRRS